MTFQPPTHAMLITIGDYPQLKLICWNRQPTAQVDDETAFALYERNWRHVDVEALGQEERALIDRLTLEQGQGVMNV